MAGFFDILKEPPVPYPGDEKFPLFNRISIEPISFCNRSCSFCPVAWHDRGKETMRQALYDKVVRELSDLKFDGVAQLFLLSEPMIDHTMAPRAKQLRDACPDVSLYISTNGDVLDAILKRSGVTAAVAKLAEYYAAGINVININAYDPGPEQLDRYRLIEAEAHLQIGAQHTDHKYRWHRPKGRYLCVTDMRFDEREAVKGTDVFYMRNAEGRAEMKAKGEVVPQRHCMRTQRHIVVLFDGRVPICCAIDPSDESLLVGDINTQSLEEVWNSEIFFKYRYFTQQARRVLPGCDTCTHKMAFPHVVRKIAPADDFKDKWEGEIR